MANGVADRLRDFSDEEWTTKLVREEAAELLDTLQKQIEELQAAFHDVNDLLYAQSRSGKQCRSCTMWGGRTHMAGCPVAEIEALVSG